MQRLILLTLYACVFVRGESDPDLESLTDLSSAKLRNKYCRSPGRRCEQTDIEANFAGTEFVCTTRCNVRSDCRNVHYDTSTRVCYIQGKRCQDTQLARATGNDLYRLTKGESCPSGRPEYRVPEAMYGDKYCMAWGKRCAGKGYYKKPQNIATMEGCMQKCSNIKECSMVNFKDGKCEPLVSTACPDEILSSEADMQNFLRLPLGESGCPDSRTEPSTTQPTEPPTQPPTEPPTDEPETVTPEKESCGGRQYRRVIKAGRGKVSVTAECNPGCVMIACHCRKWAQCDGARFTEDGECIASLKRKFVGNKSKQIEAVIRCAPASRYDTKYISTSVPGEELKCGRGYKRGDCAFYARKRGDRTGSLRRRNGRRRCGVNHRCKRIGRCRATAVCRKKL